MGSIINLFAEMTWERRSGGSFRSLFSCSTRTELRPQYSQRLCAFQPVTVFRVFKTFFTGGGRPFAPLKLEQINIFLKKEREV